MDPEVLAAIARLCQLNEDLNDLSTILNALLEVGGGKATLEYVGNMIDALDAIDTYKHVTGGQ